MTALISEIAARRAASAMLRALGGAEVVVRTAIPIGDERRGLGLGQYEVGEVRLQNALVKRTADEPTKLEIVVAAAEVETKLGVGNEDAHNALRNLAGVAWGGRLLHVTGVTADLFAGCAYLYRISAEE